MTPVGRPEAIAGRYRDHRIEKQARGPDGIGQARGMRLRQVALKGRRRDLLQGK